MNDKAEMARTKKETDYSKMFTQYNCPQSLRSMKAHLETLDFYSEPHYDQLMKDFQTDLGFLPPDHPFDWEHGNPDPATFNTDTIRTESSLLEENDNWLTFALACVEFICIYEE